MPTSSAREFVKPMVIDRSRCSFVECPRFLKLRALGIVSGDSPAIGMLTRKSRERSRCFRQDDAEFRKLRGNDTEQTTHVVAAFRADSPCFKYGVREKRRRLFRQRKTPILMRSGDEVVM